METWDQWEEEPAGAQAAPPPALGKAGGSSALGPGLSASGVLCALSDSEDTGMTSVGTVEEEATGHVLPRKCRNMAKAVRANVSELWKIVRCSEQPREC